MIQLRSIGIKPGTRKMEGFPFSLPLVRNFREVQFTSAVTFLVGENGSGKSTLLEALAVGVDAVAVGGEDISRDRTLAHVKALAGRLNFAWRKRSHRGFFLRAEDFFNFARRMQAKVKELDEMAEEFERELTGYGLSLAKG